MPTLVTSNSNQAITVDLEQCSWRILAFENMPWGFNNYRQNSVAWIDLEWNIIYSYNPVSEHNYNIKWSIKLDMCYDQQVDSWGCNYLPFSLEQYEKIVWYYSSLEAIYWYPLELEFVVHDWEIYFIQTREITTNFIKPENMVKPNKRVIKELLLSSDEEKNSCMWYINNEELNIIRLYDYIFWSYEQKEIFLYERVKQLDSSSESWYMVVIDWLSDFPYIKVSDNTNLRWIVMSWTKWLWTHALMRIRELWIPVIFLEHNSKFFSKNLSGKWKVFMEWSKWAMIYK